MAKDEGRIVTLWLLVPNIFLSQLNLCLCTNRIPMEMVNYCYSYSLTLLEHASASFLLKQSTTTTMNYNAPPCGKFTFRHLSCERPLSSLILAHRSYAAHCSMLPCEGTKYPHTVRSSAPPPPKRPPVGAGSLTARSSPSRLSSSSSSRTRHAGSEVNTSTRTWVRGGVRGGGSMVGRSDGGEVRWWGGVRG